MLHIKNTRKIILDSNVRTAVALGKFDGLHLGHMLLIDEVTGLQREGYTGVVFTFDMRENHVFDVSSMKAIYTSEEKACVAESAGVDMLAEYPFDDAFAAMTPLRFISDILKDMLHAAWIVVGSDYRFGRERGGGVDTLMQYAKEYGYRVKVMDKLRSGEQTVSSTAIRGLISQGDMSGVIPLLGRPYSMTGEVVYGRQLGRTLGIPTANILPAAHKLYPPAGVYASRVTVSRPHTANTHMSADELRTYRGVTNIGDNPTVDGSGNVTIETHIIDFDEDIYGAHICVELTDRLRGEMRFDSVDELKRQMETDIGKRKEML